MAGALDQTTAQFGRHVEDLEDVLSHYGRSQAHLIGWCTGADVVLEFARLWPARVGGAVCLNGSLVGLCEARLPFQLNLLGIVRHVTSSRNQARLYHSLMAGSSRSDAGDPEARSSVESALVHLDPELMHLTSAPLRSPEALERYCILLDHYLKEAPRSLPSAAMGALMVTCEDDSIAHPDATRSVARRMPNASLRVQSSGGHFAPRRDEELIREVARFLNAAPPSGSNS